jgi:hypothetical protein
VKQEQPVEGMSMRSKKQRHGHRYHGDRTALGTYKHMCASSTPPLVGLQMSGTGHGAYVYLKSAKCHLLGSFPTDKPANTPDTHHCTR